MLSGREGEWDENLESAFAIKWKGEYLLYFSGYRHAGYPAQEFPASLALATSNDAVHFTRQSDDPILAPTRGWYDNDAIYSPTIVETDDRLVMIYAGHCYTRCEHGFGNVLLAATSNDGLAWTKINHPVLTGGIPDAVWTRMAWQNRA